MPTTDDPRPEGGPELVAWKQRHFMEHYGTPVLKPFEEARARAAAWEPRPCPEDFR